MFPHHIFVICEIICENMRHIIIYSMKIPVPNCRAAFDTSFIQFLFEIQRLYRK